MSIGAILDRIVADGFSASNIAFGMGGALLQRLDRDTLAFAYMTSAVDIRGVWRDGRLLADRSLTQIRHRAAEFDTSV